MKGTAYEIKQMGNTEILRKTRVGRWQVTVMKRTMVRTAADPSKRDFIPEMEFEQLRTCVQLSRFNRRTKEWHNQQIWCDSTDDLRGLVETVDKLNESASTEEAYSFLR